MNKTLFPASRLASRTVVALMSLALTGIAAAGQPAHVQDSAGQKALDAMPHKAGERPVVSIYEFRSTLPSYNSRSATDMFVTALAKTHQFRVVERQRLSEGVGREKMLQQSGWASGTAGASQLRGAQYIFEGAVTELNAGEKGRSGGVSVAGMQIGGSSNTDSIGIDVRVLDASSGDVLDVISVSKPIKATGASLSGIGSLVSTVMAQHGKSSPFTPDAQVSSSSNEGQDAALRAAIDEAVRQLATRFGTDAGAE